MFVFLLIFALFGLGNTASLAQFNTDILFRPFAVTDFPTFFKLLLFYYRVCEISVLIVKILTRNHFRLNIHGLVICLRMLNCLLLIPFWFLSTQEGSLLLVWIILHRRSWECRDATVL